MTDDTKSLSEKWPQKESTQFYAVFVVIFITFLVVAIGSQLLMLQWRPWFPGAEGEKSLIGGVKGAVYTLMSHLQ
jgi:light-harvesting complex 1 beta chain